MITVTPNVLTNEICEGFIQSLDPNATVPFGYSDGDDYSVFKIVKWKGLRTSLFEHLNFKNPTGAQVLKYPPGAFLGVHADGVKYENGKLIQKTDHTMNAIIFLNENYKGGILNFPQHDMAIAPKTGTMVTYPSSLDYQHGVTPVIEGNRYVFVVRYNEV